MGLRIAMVGTDLAPLRPESGALERVVLSWAADLRRAGHRVVLLDASRDGPPENALERAHPDVVVLNNRPLWAERVEVPSVQVLHNYPDAWGEGAADRARVAAALSASARGAVSPTLARDVVAAYDLTAEVGVVRGEVEERFFREQWRGGEGLVLFPNRLLEKKGVRFFLELSQVLAGDGLDCLLFRHLAPWTSPTPEQADLLAAIASCPSVTLLEPPASRRALASWYARASAVLCPSIVPEGLGMVALEAQAVGAPVVTSGRGGLADATFPPNEVVADLEVESWRAAVHRAVERAETGRDATEAVADAHSRGAATASVLALVERATSRC